MAKTPLIKIENFYLKREDLNDTGSAKDRSLLLQVQYLKSQGFHHAVISSTGNAAISASHFCQINQIKLTVFLSPNINPKKLELIKNHPCEIIFSPKPISDAIKFSKNQPAYLLRQSTDPQALIGYQEIGRELIDQIPQVTSIFIPVGSGTTLLGISQSIPSSVKIFAIQPATNCPLSKIFDQDYQPESQVITDAITVKFLPLKSKIIETIKRTQGTGLVVQNSDILSAQKYLKSHQINTSLEGAMALSGLQKAQKLNIDIGDYPVILLTGCQR